MSAPPASSSRDGAGAKSPYSFTLQTEEVDALGTSFQVVYADEGSPTDPVIVCVHGAPATHKAYRHVVEGLTSKGYRVIIPNMPGMGLTALDPDGIYNHTSEHKAEVIKGLLEKIGIKSVATVVGHSMGGHVTCQLAADPALEGSIKSICLLSSAGSRPHRLFSPYWLYFIFGQLIYFSIKLPIIGTAVKRLVSNLIAAAGLRGLTRDAEVFSWYEGSQLHFKKFATNVERLVQLDLPALCVYSSNDKFVEMPVLEDTILRLGMRPEDTIKYNEEGVTMEKFKEGSLKRAVEFEKGTHMVHYVYPEQVIKEMLAFLHEVVRPQ
ncbi:uncharacterized protein LOC110977988 [Acanthaster planci]|uniref:Uncharacterized protein LOC110977988 n=1 Tax=Acanthaster planci TaxID=133434 RepID=A0A8B7Y6T3_ACAPL|nr:uncharacterized protein LOC110977988 [Acanthaster planci]XP_022088272.1 uncharacterized protein LOC110977988 [Acanthaster planci]XP_022088273.1 uncharacterized protein LOC110977988 [Acanthaster planci]XP_022088274.1 uncharacterized protein LOC110977988 [Acanthaster planci]XP_022088275.1 uncharacterized protein LOC110977988 [Acanthaster planci]